MTFSISSLTIALVAFLFFGSDITAWINDLLAGFQG